MILNSLSGRLLLASALLLPLFLGLTGFFLDHAFQRSLNTAEAERLKTNIYLLLGSAEARGETLVLPDELQDPRFSQLQSGLYGIINDDQGEIWRSNSARLLPSHLAQHIKKLEAGNEDFSSISLSDETLFSYSYAVIWESNNGIDQHYQFTVLHSQVPMQAELKSYRNELWHGLGVAALLFLIAQIVIMHWGLKPLKKLATDLNRVETGEKDILNDEYPKEIQPVTDNLNKLIYHERSQRERYRNTLADLAHSLKTPLAVIHGTMENNTQPSEQQQVMNEQLQRMNDIVSHQLQRAVIHSPTLSQKPVIVTNIVERLGDALGKVYLEKNIQLHNHVNAEILFYGDEHDLMELLGNLLENAFKYGRHKVYVDAIKQPETLILQVEDDGPGIPSDRVQEILQRGTRVDTSPPGQGIGLAVVNDIVKSYHGSLHIDGSSLGGSIFTISLPLKR